MELEVDTIQSKLIKEDLKKKLIEYNKELEKTQNNYIKEKEKSKKKILFGVDNSNEEFNEKDEEHMKTLENSTNTSKEGIKKVNKMLIIAEEILDIGKESAKMLKKDGEHIIEINNKIENELEEDVEVARKKVKDMETSERNRRIFMAVSIFILCLIILIILYLIFRPLIEPFINLIFGKK
jgi:hypothetical protein